MCPNHPDPSEETQARIKSAMWTETRAAYAYVGLIAAVLFPLVMEITK
jgi:hypothetical protein